MPVKVGQSGAWQTIQPTTDWTLLPAFIPRDRLDEATDLYYITVIKR